MKLYFLRHGIAVDSADWSGSEFDRPLTDDGRDRMLREAKTLAKLKVCPDVILTSPLVRARQTAHIAAEALACKRLENDDRLANGFDARNVAEIAAEHRDAGAIMLVGHEPTMSATIGVLIGGARIDLKKGGLALIELTDPAKPAGELVWLVPPKVLTVR